MSISRPWRAQHDRRHGQCRSARNTGKHRDPVRWGRAARGLFADGSTLYILGTTSSTFTTALPDGARDAGCLERTPGPGARPMAAPGRCEHCLQHLLRAGFVAGSAAVRRPSSPARTPQRAAIVRNTPDTDRQLSLGCAGRRVGYNFVADHLASTTDGTHVISATASPTPQLVDSNVVVPTNAPPPAGETTVSGACPTDPTTKATIPLTITILPTFRCRWLRTRRRSSTRW